MQILSVDDAIKRGNCNNTVREAPKYINITFFKHDQIIYLIIKLLH